MRAKRIKEASIQMSNKEIDAATFLRRVSLKNFTLPEDYVSVDNVDVDLVCSGESEDEYVPNVSVPAVLTVENTNELSSSSSNGKYFLFIYSILYKLCLIEF